MKMLNLVVGNLETNCYILYEEGSCIIIDPGAESENIKKRINKIKCTPVGILLTHNHFDHTGAAEELSSFYRCPIYDYKNLKEGIKQIDIFTFEVLETKGHSNTSLTFYFEDYNFMLTGDFIFKENIGRVDLPGGNYSEMLESIKKIKQYDKDIVLYPGHGDKTTIGHELKHNKYFR